MKLNYTDVGKRIQYYRQISGKTQEEVAEKADISNNYLSKLETGKSAGSLEKYCNIAQVLGVTVDMLINNISDSVSANDYLFLNQLSPLVSSLSIEQRKMLVDYIELLKKYDVDKIKTD